MQLKLCTLFTHHVDPMKTTAKHRILARTLVFISDHNVVFHRNNEWTHNSFIVSYHNFVMLRQRVSQLITLAEIISFHVHAFVILPFIYCTCAVYASVSLTVKLLSSYFPLFSYTGDGQNLRPNSCFSRVFNGLYLSSECDLGSVSIYEYFLTSIGVSTMKIRRYHLSYLFYENPISGKKAFILEWGPASCVVLLTMLVASVLSRSQLPRFDQ